MKMQATLWCDSKTQTTNAPAHTEHAEDSRRLKDITHAECNCEGREGEAAHMGRTQSNNG